MHITLMLVILTECLGLILNNMDRTIYHMTANFGIQRSSPSYKRSAPLVLADPEHGCGDLLNESELDGKIVLVKWGKCSCFNKSVNVFNYGGKGIVIGNNPGSGLIRMEKEGSETEDVGIPSVLISNLDFKEVRSIITQQTSMDVVATLSANEEWIDDSATKSLARAFTYMMLILPSTWTMLVLLWACFSLLKRRVMQRQVREIPEIIFSSDMLEAESLKKKHIMNSSCPICLVDFEEQTRIKLLPCDHGFHPECIEPWIGERSDSCPICRQSVMDKLEAAERGAPCCYNVRSRHSLREDSSLSIVEAAVLNVQASESIENYNSSESIEQYYDIPQFEQTSELEFLSESQLSVEADDAELIGAQPQLSPFVTVIVRAEAK